MINKLELFNKTQLKKDLPDIRPGDTILVSQKIKEGESAILSLWGRVTKDGRYIPYQNFWGRHFEFEVERADSKPSDERVTGPKYRDALVAIHNTSPVSSALYSVEEYDRGNRGIPTAKEFKRESLYTKRLISIWPGGGDMIFTQEDLDYLDELENLL